MGTDPAAQPPVNTNDLRRHANAPCIVRSGKIAIWPYIRRELPDSPVKALRLELRYRERQPLPTASSLPDKGIQRKGVEYFPALLDETEGVPETELARGLRTGSELDGFRAKLAEVHRCQQHLLHHAATLSSRQQAASNKASPERLARRYVGRRPASSGRRRQEPTSMSHLVAGAVPSPLCSGNGDFTECPLGCGEEVRVYDLAQHQTSLCSLRYVECLMPGCPTLVQARSLGLHMRRDCPKRRKQRILADKGRTLEIDIACADCGEELPRKRMRTHRANDCPVRMVVCSNPDCADAVQAKDLADHQRLYCKTARSNAKLNERATKRPAAEECTACHETVAANVFRRHTTEECAMRIVACPNAYLGCGEQLKAAEVPFHLLEQCLVQIERAERASRFPYDQRVKCSACGYMVIIRHLARHHRTKCPNRRVPCKHWELGCPAMLRLSAMDDHLKVDRLVEPRSCLVFDSGKAYIALGEDDRKPPWTVEMWIWRPGLIEGTREKARTALKAYWEFQQARERLAATERRLRVLEPLLVDTATRAAKERSVEAEKARDKLTDEMMASATLRDEAKVELVVSIIVFSNSLASVTKEIQEITACDQLRGFDRLALGSTPWYAVPSTLAKNSGLRQGRGSPSEKMVIGSERITGPESRASPLPAEVQRAKQVVLEPGATAGVEKTHETSGPDEPQERGPETPPLGADGGKSSEDTAGDSHVAVVPIDTNKRLATLAKEQHALREAEEEASRLKEAVYWAEWVALSGQSLARRLLNLAKILPHLKDEAAAITGLPIEIMFRPPGDKREGEPLARDNSGEGAADIESTASTKKSRKQKKVARKAKRKQKHGEKFGKSIETRVAEEVGKRGGVETLFGSDKAMFQLEMGPKDKVGIKVAGKEEVFFNYRCPRERWVHLSFVADATSVILLENGQPASRLGDLTVRLPMREIGGMETACQCLMQELRYWKVKRSKEDLLRWMHQILPNTAVEDGLIGHWTFEEGAGEHVNDVTEQRFRSRRVGRGLKWAVPELMCSIEVGAPPTPSWREKHVCKVELRRGKLAQRGRLHQQYISCPADCGETFLRRNERAHVAYRCPMRVVTCSMAGCEKRTPQKDLARHLEEDCPSHAAWLRMAEAGDENREYCFCSHCGESVRRCNLKVHEKYVCQWLKEPCRNAGCAAFIPRIRRAEHERRICMARSALRRRQVLARARARSTYRRDWAEEGNDGQDLIVTKMA